MPVEHDLGRDLELSKYILEEMIRPLYNGRVIGGGVSIDGFPLLKFQWINKDGSRTERWVAISMDDEMNEGGRIMFLDDKEEE